MEDDKIALVEIPHVADSPEVADQSGPRRGLIF
jgi:hypothetical protein